MKIAVLGMHRSGTSLVSMILEEAGFFVGEKEDQLLPQNDNPRGFGERKDVVNYNDEFLRSQNLEWHLLSHFEAIKFHDDDIKALKARAQSVLNTLDQHENWLLKDPRLSLTLPYWGVQDLQCIVMLRNPMEVALSLQARNGFSLEHGLALWELYTKWSFKTASQYQNVLVLDHQEISQDPEAFLNKLVPFTGLSFEELKKAYDEVFTSKLRRNVALGHNLPSDIDSYFESLKNGQYDETTLSSYSENVLELEHIRHLLSFELFNELKMEVEALNSSKRMKLGGLLLQLLRPWKKVQPQHHYTEFVRKSEKFNGLLNLTEDKLKHLLERTVKE